MGLTAGQTLSYYEILGSLGVGAMGEVYRALDTRLGREVAVKVLPERFAEDEERLQRFEREARSLASLNHPNVAQIFGVDQIEDTCFLVLELVPGETLEERIERGALPIDEAFEVCRQIAEGLEAAHEAGVIHRDLKPANVRITPEGKVKVLDFGLAKPIESGSQTDSALSTEAGRVIGTPTYMAPEQARGRPIDRRVDVWAFGCVLFECLSGTRPFPGETISDVLAAVLQDEPDWSRLPPTTPTRTRELIDRCLQKDPRLRLRDVGDAWLLLRPTGTVDPVEAAPQDGAVSLRGFALAGIALLVGTVGGFLLRPGAETEAPPARATQTSFHVPLAQSVRLDGSAVLALSPDGRTVAWVGGPTGSLFVREVDSFETRALPATENAVSPFFSPDSKRLGFWKEGELLSISLASGTLSKIADVPNKPRQFRGASWGDDGTIVFAPGIASGIFRVPAEGGEVEPVTTLDPESDVRTHRFPVLLPGSEVVLYTRDAKRTSEFHDDASLVAHSLVTGEERVVVEGAGQARYGAGHVVFVRGAALHALRFDPNSLEVSGEPIEIVSGVESQTTTGVAFFDVARDGTLAYQPGLDRAQSKRLAWRRPASPPELFELPPGSYEAPRVSPDGASVSYVTQGPDVSELWLYSTDRDSARLLLRRPDILTPVWGPSSERIYFGSGLGHDPALYELAADGTGEPRLVYAAEPGHFVTPTSVTKDGETVLVVEDDKLGQVDVVGVDVASGASRDVIVTDGVEAQPAIDPSGAWMAFVRLRDGEPYVWLTTVEPGGPLLQVAHRPSRGPHWAADGASIYFLRPATRELWEVDVELGDEPKALTPRLFLDDFYWDENKQYNYHVAPDGRVLSMVDIGSSELGRELRVQSRWLEQVRAAQD